MKKFTAVLLIMIVAATVAAQTEITGFVDGAFTWNPADEAGEFGLDQVEVDILHQSSESTMLRADLEWVKDGEEFVAQVEQGYMTWTSPCGRTLTFGKFNAPIGFELLDAPDMYQYSHALVFDHGLPTNLTGAMMDFGLGEKFHFAGYVVNGWDANTAAGKNVTLGGRLGFADGGFAGGVSAISGKQDLDLNDTMTPVTRTVFDVDLGYVVNAWTFGGEINMGTATVPGPGGDVDSDWTGFMAMTHYDFTDVAGITIRFDHFDDSDGWAFGTVGGETQTRQAITIAPTCALADNCGALIEFRMDMSDKDAFVDADGDPTDSSTMVAFEMTYTW